MPLNGFYPKHRHVLMCDFERGFVAPEMVKRRPVVVISKAETHGRRLCTVVPLSTTPCVPEMDWHYLLQQNPLRGTPPHTSVWAKCDMLYTVSFDRLDKPHTKSRQGRQYYVPKLCEADWDGLVKALKTYLP